MNSPAPVALSFNEVAALVTKAARGAGLGWGHAEDLGRAARWLAEHGVAWDAASCDLLASDDAARHASGMLEVADWAAHAAKGATRTFDGGENAIWMLPLALTAIFGRKGSLTVSWSGATIHLRPDGGIASCDLAWMPDFAGQTQATSAVGFIDEPFLSLVSDRNLIPRAQSGTMTLEAVSDPPACLVPIKRLARPGPVPHATLTRLSALADLTLVPASEASRTKGAGSVRSDND